MRERYKQIGAFSWYLNANQELLTQLVEVKFVISGENGGVAMIVHSVVHYYCRRFRGYKSWRLQFCDQQKV